MRREGGKKMKEGRGGEGRGGEVRGGGGEGRGGEGRGGEGEVYTINKLRSVSEMSTENTSE